MGAFGFFANATFRFSEVCGAEASLALLVVVLRDSSGAACESSSKSLRFLEVFPSFPRVAMSDWLFVLEGRRGVFSLRLCSEEVEGLECIERGTSTYTCECRRGMDLLLLSDIAAGDDGGCGLSRMVAFSQTTGTRLST